jgi:hypothetical protein
MLRQNAIYPFGEMDRLLCEPDVFFARASVRFIDDVVAETHGKLHIRHRRPRRVVRVVAGFVGDGGRQDDVCRSFLFGPRGVLRLVCSRVFGRSGDAGATRFDRDSVFDIRDIFGHVDNIQGALHRGRIVRNKRGDGVL